MTHTPSPAAKRSPASDHGFVLPSAIIILFVLTLLTGAAISVATQTSTSTTRDNNVKAEVEAAEAGLHMASYRISQLKPSESQCINEGKAVEAKSKSEAESKCTDSSESLGNGASFRYWTSLPMTSGNCAGRAVAKVAGAVQRCVTAEGKVHGVEPVVRLQALAAATAASPPLLPVHGVTALNSFYEKNNAAGNADVGGNGTIEIDKNEMTGSWLLGPGATQTGEAPSGGTKSVPAFSLAPVPIEGVENSNNDGVLTVAQGFKASDYSLSMTENLTLPAGDYYFCHINFGGHSVINTAGGTVRIFVDAPPAVRSASKCPENLAGSGYYGSADGTNGVELNPNGNASNLQIYIYGWPPTGLYALAHGGVNTLYLKNNGAFTGMIYAPNSHVEFKNSGTITGGIAAYDVVMKNNTTVNWDSSLSNVGAAEGSAKRQAWEQCVSGSGPTASC